jgi:hypothetical protein
MSGARIVKITAVIGGKPVREGVSAYVINNTSGFFASMHLYPADEGVTWIRDWHEDDSEPVAALMAAHRLRPTGHVYTSATISGCWSSTGPSGPSDDVIPFTRNTRAPVPSTRFHPIPNKHAARRR